MGTFSKIFKKCFGTFFICAFFTLNKKNPKLCFYTFLHFSSTLSKRFRKFENFWNLNFRSSELLILLPFYSFCLPFYVILTLFCPTVSFSFLYFAHHFCTLLCDRYSTSRFKTPLFTTLLCFTVLFSTLLLLNFISFTKRETRQHHPKGRGGNRITTHKGEGERSVTRKWRRKAAPAKA